VDATVALGRLPRIQNRQSSFLSAHILIPPSESVFHQFRVEAFFAYKDPAQSALVLIGVRWY
jgi:hypothetical protein